MYSAFINKRLLGYLENNNILGDEQNGFRSNRSCEDHVFVLNSLIRNKANVFTAFIDLHVHKQVQVGKDQEKAQSEKDSHSKNRGGEKTKLTIRYSYHETNRKPNEQLFSQ